MQILFFPIVHILMHYFILFISNEQLRCQRHGAYICVMYTHIPELRLEYILDFPARFPYHLATIKSQGKV